MTFRCLFGSLTAASLGMTLLFSTSAYAQDTSADRAREANLTVVLDPEADTSARVAELQILKDNARSGDHASICTLGRLAFAGERHAAKLPSFAYGDAAAWLNRCALGGDLDAMLVMAEVEIRDRRGLEAMIWIQAYLKLAATLAPDTVNDASPYKAGILARIEKLYSSHRPSNEEVLEFVAGFLSSYGERIATAHRAGGWASWPALPAQPELEMRKGGASLSGRFTRDMSSATDELVYATYLVEVASNGKPGRILVFESYPDQNAARSLKSYPLSRRFNAVDSRESRWLYLPVYMDNKAYDLLPDASAKHRPRAR